MGIHENATLSVLLWRYRLRPLPLGSGDPTQSGDLRSQIGFSGMVSFGAASFPAETSMDVAERHWAANLYRAEAAALLCLAPGATARRLAEASGSPASRSLSTLDADQRAVLARAAEVLGVQDRGAWIEALDDRLDSCLREPETWRAVESLAASVATRGELNEIEVEDLLGRLAAPREPWPSWMPGEGPSDDFYF